MTPDRVIAAVISGLLLALLVTVLTIAAIDYQERHRGKHRQEDRCPQGERLRSSTPKSTR